MANNYFLFSEFLKVENKEELDWIGDRIKELLKKLEDEGDGESLGFEFDLKDGTEPGDSDKGVWFYSEESGDLEQVVGIVQEYLKKFSPDSYWAVEWAETCSRPVAGEFGGGAVFVTATGDNWLSTSDWLRKQKDKFEKKAKGGK